MEESKGRVAQHVKRCEANAAKKVQRAEADLKAIPNSFVKEQAMRRQYYNELEDLRGKSAYFAEFGH